MSPDVDPLDAVADAPTAAARLARVFDRVFTSDHVHRLERWIILLAVGGFALHLGLISIARNLDVGGSPLAQLDRNYLHALYTPFSFILFFEVLQLILAIPQSTTGSIQRQFEIVSLIVIRNVFKDISLFESFEVVRERFAEFADVLTDMGGGLLMFLLVAVFSDVRRRDARWRTPLREVSPPVRDFILRKKATSLLLALLFIGLAGWNLGLWVLDVARTGAGAPPTIDVRTVFYVDLFTVMIFSDVLILLLSTLHSNDYRMVFRNAGFVVCTILIRFSLTLEKPYDVGLGIVAMAFGILVLLVYHYFRRIGDPRAPSALELPG